MMLVQQLVQPPEPPSGLPVQHPIHASRQLPTSTTLPKPQHYQQSTPITQPPAHTPSRSTTNPTTPTSKPSFTLRPATLADAPSIAHLGASTFSASFGFSVPTADLNTYLSEAYSISAISKDVSDPTKHWVVAVAVAATNPSDRPESTENTSDSTNTTTTTTTSSTTGSTSAFSSETLLGFAHLSLTTPDPCLSNHTCLSQYQYQYQSKSHSNSHTKSHINSYTSPSTPSPSLIELQRLYVSPMHHSHGIGQSLLHHISTHAQSLKHTHLWLGVWEGNFKAQRVYEKAGFERAGEHEFVMGRCVQTDWIMVKEL